MSAKGFLVLVAFVLLIVYAAVLPRWLGPHTGSRPTAILAEIDQLHSGMQAYKEQHLAYPPSMAVANVDARKAKFMSHLRTVYPSSAYGARAKDFDTLNAYIAANYQVQGPNGTISLDLENLDQAESLVFWLGGFPIPINTAAGGSGQPIAPSRLFGFNRDRDSPFKRSYAAEANDPLLTRTTPYLEFRQERLVDNDGDGWWEYLPMSPSTGDVVAPFVYFDSDAYVGASAPSECSPYPRTGDAQAASLQQSFGTAVPFAAYFDPAGKNVTRWQNPDSFQIICGGLDGRYSAPDAPPRMEIFPSGAQFAGPGFNVAAGNYDDEELDNLTNLQRVPLGDARREARDGYPGGDTADVSIAVPIILWSVLVLIVAYSIHSSARSRRIDGRTRTNAPPDFSHVGAEKSVTAEVDASRASEPQAPPERPW
jgi:hypothetical protein